MILAAFNWDFLTATLNTTPYTACVDYNRATFSPPYNIPEPYVSVVFNVCTLIKLPHPCSDGGLLHRNDEAGQIEKKFWTDLFALFMSSDQDPSEPFSDFW
jgi:hypothetical protein